MSNSNFGRVIHVYAGIICSKCLNMANSADPDETPLFLRRLVRVYAIYKHKYASVLND